MGNRWGNETVSDFILGGSKITADGDCSHEIKRHLLLGRKIMTNLDSILKSRDITFEIKQKELFLTVFYIQKVFRLLFYSELQLEVDFLLPFPTEY